MKTNQAGLDLIGESEGLVLTAYQENLGNGKVDVPTIGFGHTTAAGPPTVYMGMVITKDQAYKILQADLAAVEAQVLGVVKVPLNDNQFAALVSFTFNEGIGDEDTPGLGLKGSTLLKRLNTGDYNIGNEFGKWVYAQGIQLPGLVTRRAKEKALWETQPNHNTEQEASRTNTDNNNNQFVNFLFWLIQKIFGGK